MGSSKAFGVRLRLRAGLPGGPVRLRYSKWMDEQEASQEPVVDDGEKPGHCVSDCCQVSPFA